MKIKRNGSMSHFLSNKEEDEEEEEEGTTLSIT